MVEPGLNNIADEENDRHRDAAPEATAPVSESPYMTMYPNVKKFLFFQCPTHYFEFKEWKQQNLSLATILFIMLFLAIPGMATRFNLPWIGLGTETIAQFVGQLSLVPLNALLVTYTGSVATLVYHPVPVGPDAPPPSYVQGWAMWMLTKTNIEDSICYGCVVANTSIFLGRVMHGACTEAEAANIWLSQQCNPVANRSVGLCDTCTYYLPLVIYLFLVFPQPLCSARLSAGDVHGAPATARRLEGYFVPRCADCLHGVDGRFALHHGYFGRLGRSAHAAVPPWILGRLLHRREGQPHQLCAVHATSRDSRRAGGIGQAVAGAGEPATVRSCHPLPSNAHVCRIPSGPWCGTSPTRSARRSTPCLAAWSAYTASY